MSDVMTLEKWIELAKEQFKGKPPKLHYDEDSEEWWVGYTFRDHGFASEMPLARGMMESTARFFQEKIAELFVS